MSRVSWVRVVSSTAVVGVLAATSSCSDSTVDGGGAAPATSSASSPTGTGGACGFPAAPVARIATRWREVTLAPDERAARTAAVRYRDAIGRVRTSFAITCPDLEETFNQVFVDAQFLVERTGAEDDLQLADLVRNGETLVDALGLQDQVRFVAADCSVARQDDPACQAVP